MKNYNEIDIIMENNTSKGNVRRPGVCQELVNYYVLQLSSYIKNKYYILY